MNERGARASRANDRSPDPIFMICLSVSGAAGFRADSPVHTNAAYGERAECDASSLVPANRAIRRRQLAAR
jgi:hypothetical protein